MTRERGQALVETVLLGLLLIAPFVWLLTVLADIHRGALATTAAAREAGARAARTASSTSAGAEIDAAVAEALRNHGIDPDDASVAWSAPPRFSRGSAVEIEVSYPVRVLRAPLLGDAGGPVVWVRARHIARIDPYRSRG